MASDQAMEPPPRTSMNSRGLMATPSPAEANIFDTGNDSTPGRRGVGDNIRGAPAAAVPLSPARRFDFMN
jgi:hypothetical protein